MEIIARHSTRVEQVERYLPVPLEKANIVRDEKTIIIVIFTDEHVLG